MTFELVLTGAAIHILIWEKLPEWGTWFNALLRRLPRPLQTLYEQWHCPFCAGFWIALALHAATGLWTLPVLAGLPDYPLGLNVPVGWLLDALACAILILAVILAIKAISLPAMRAHMMKEDFMKAFRGAGTAEEPSEGTR